MAPTLSPRQAAIVKLIGDGKADKQIADELGISENTVAAHLRMVFHRLKARSRAHAVAISIRHRII